MIKTLASYIKEYTKASVLTPLLMIGEVVMETVIPLLMAMIIDEGVNGNDLSRIFEIGGWMMVCAVLGLLFGVLGAKYGSYASTGFAKNLRKGMYDNIQTFSFSNIDKFSTAGLVTRMTTDVTNVQNAYLMLLRKCFRAPFSMICAMIMAFFINARLASVYLIAVVALGLVLGVIISQATKHFRAAFPKYDDLNASVQENISGIRVVKAYVQEDHENKKIGRAHV